MHLSMSLAIPYSLAATTAAVVAGSGVGVWLGGRGRQTRIVPFSGGVLAGIALFWVLPELAGRFGWLAGAGWLAGGFAVLLLVDRHVYPVCPTCSHTHDHDECETRLHGFATPLILAAALHSFFDGLGLAASLDAGMGELGRAVFWGISLHKIPEGLALGVFLRASLRSWQMAMIGCAATQAPMIAGGALEALVAPRFGSAWLVTLLALAGGSFLFLGFHAVHGEWKRRGAVPAFVAACVGAAVAAGLQHTLNGLHH